jgi:hypothetical protein
LKAYLKDSKISKTLYFRSRLVSLEIQSRDSDNAPPVVQIVNASETFG